MSEAEAMALEERALEGQLAEKNGELTEAKRTAEELQNKVEEDEADKPAFAATEAELLSRTRELMLFACGLSKAPQKKILSLYFREPHQLWMLERALASDRCFGLLFSDAAESGADETLVDAAFAAVGCGVGVPSRRASRASLLNGR